MLENIYKLLNQSDKFGKLPLPSLLNLNLSLQRKCTQLLPAFGYHPNDINKENVPDNRRQVEFRSERSLVYLFEDTFPA